jgi:hypothetical protein
MGLLQVDTLRYRPARDLFADCREARQTTAQAGTTEPQ